MERENDEGRITEYYRRKQVFQPDMPNGGMKSGIWFKKFTMTV